MLRVSPSSGSVWNFDMNDDVDDPGDNGDEDPLFRFVDITGTEVVANLSGTGAGVQVNVWTGNWDVLRKGFLIRQNTAGIKFRNDQ